MQIYEVFRKKSIAEAGVAAPARPTAVPRTAVGGVPNPLAQRMPGGMATSLRQTQTGQPPANAANAAYGRVTSNVPQMRSPADTTAVATQTGRAVTPAAGVPTTVPGQASAQRINVDDVLDANLEVLDDSTTNSSKSPNVIKLELLPET